MVEAPPEAAKPANGLEQAPAPSVRGAALWSMAGQYVVFGVTFVTGVIISRFFLGPEEVGLFSIALAAAMIVSVFQDFGITRYVVGEPELSSEQIRTCFSVSLVVAIGIGLVILCLAWPIAAFYGDGRLIPVVAVIAASYLLVPFGIVPAALLQRKMDFRSLFVVNSASILAMGGTAVWLAAAGYSALSLSWAIVAQAAVKAVLGIALSGCRPPWPLTFAGARPVLRFGSKMMTLFGVAAVGIRSPDLVVGRVAGIAETGLFSRATSLAHQLVTLLTGAVGAVFYPAFARLRDRGEDLAPPYLRVTAGFTAVTWPGMAFLAAAALPVVLFLYGEGWAEVAPLLVLIALSEFFFTALPLQGELPILLGRIRLLLVLNVIETVISILLLVVAGLWSLEAAAASRIVYGFVWWATYAWMLRALIRLSWRELFAVYARSLAVSLAAVTPLLLVYAAVAGPAEIPFLWLLAAAAAGGLAWLGALFLVRHPARHEVSGFAEVLLKGLPARRALIAPAE
jgi:O-antigen/teichoic acid export membrane protein